MAIRSESGTKKRASAAGDTASGLLKEARRLWTVEIGVYGWGTAVKLVGGKNAEIGYGRLANL
jgi:hypothetical protein